MGAREAGQRGEQRAVVIQGFGHFVVEALVVVALDSLVAIAYSLGDEHSGAGTAVIVGELHLGYRDGKLGYA